MREKYNIKREDRYKDATLKEKSMRKRYCPIINKKCKGNKCSSYSPSEYWGADYSELQMLQDITYSEFTKNNILYYEPYCKLIDKYELIEKIDEISLVCDGD